MDTILLLVRHAETAWHGLNRVVGQNDIPLHDQGREQAASLAAGLASVSLRRIVASPLSRAVETASAIAANRSIAIEQDARLTDLRVGEWEGLELGELSKRPDFAAFVASPRGFRFPGGETIEEGAARAGEAVAELVAGGAGAYCVVTHSDIIRLLVCRYLDEDLARYMQFRVAVASVSTLTISAKGKTRLVGLSWRPSYRDVAFPSGT